MRNLIGKQNLLTAEERRQLKEWLEDTGWTALGRYAGDEEYLSYVMDILEHPVFQSMERYIQHGQTTCRDHCIRVSDLPHMQADGMEQPGVGESRSPSRSVSL